MESEAVCPTCLNILTETAQVSCGHTLCLKCFQRSETLAKNAFQKSVCLICSAQYGRTPIEIPRQSDYHDKLVSLLDPSKKKECTLCDKEPTMACEDGCGLLCEECQDKHHSIVKTTRNHIVK